MENLKILCPYCNAVYTAEMLQKLWLCEGSYTTGCVGSKMISKIEIKCRRCKKVTYSKEIREDIDFLAWEKRLK